MNFGAMLFPRSCSGKLIASIQYVWAIIKHNAHQTKQKYRATKQLRLSAHFDFLERVHICLRVVIFL